MASKVVVSALPAQAMRTDLCLPPEVWHGYVLKHTVNNVYNLQRLRAVNKCFQATTCGRASLVKL